MPCKVWTRTCCVGNDPSSHLWKHMPDCIPQVAIKLLHSRGDGSMNGEQLPLLMYFSISVLRCKYGLVLARWERGDLQTCQLKNVLRGVVRGSCLGALRPINCSRFWRHQASCGQPLFNKTGEAEGCLFIFVAVLKTDLHLSISCWETWVIARTRTAYSILTRS